VGCRAGLFLGRHFAGFQDAVDAFEYAGLGGVGPINGLPFQLDSAFGFGGIVAPGTVLVQKADNRRRQRLGYGSPNGAKAQKEKGRETEDTRIHGVE
jgi:hypothetical protein